MQTHYAEILRAAESQVEMMRRRMIRTEANRGALDLPREGIVHKLSASSPLPALVYCAPESRFFENADLLRDILDMLDYTQRNLRPDGTVDLYTANFFSAPDSAFAIHRLEDMLAAIDACPGVKGGEELRARVTETIRLLADGVMRGGFHTPNHRWVISAALSSAARTLGDFSLLERVEQYLAEGIDANEDGMYAERSSGGYDLINNHALMILARELNRPELFAPVRRNLKMLPWLFEPDGSIFTGYSTRQDHGARVWAERYFGQYLSLYHALGDAAAIQEAVRLFEAWTRGGRRAPDCLADYAREPALKNIVLPTPTAREIGTRLMPYSGMARARYGEWTATLLRGSADFLSISTRDVSLVLRIGVHFFDERHFIAQEMRLEDGAVLLRWTGKGNYRLPLESPQSTSDWWKMDHTKRKTVTELTLCVEARVAFTPDGLTLRVRTSGCDDVPVRLEWNIKDAQRVRAEGFACPWQPGARIVVRDGFVEAQGEQNDIRFGPCFAENELIDGLWGALPVSRAHMNLYTTALTHFEKELTIDVR